MPREDPSLGFLATRRLKVMVWCRSCHRSAALDPNPLIKKFGHHYPIPRMTHHLKCQVCGAKFASVYW